MIPLLDRIKTFSLLRNSGRPSAQTGTGMASSGQSPSTQVVAGAVVFDEALLLFGGRAGASSALFLAAVAAAAAAEEEEAACFFFPLAAASIEASSCLRLVILRVFLSSLA